MTVRKLSEKELDMLKALLLFPEKFCKITNHYMNSRKTWIAEKSAEKLAALIEQDAAKEIFLKDSIFKSFVNNSKNLKYFKSL